MNSSFIEICDNKKMASRITELAKDQASQVRGFLSANVRIKLKLKQSDIAKIELTLRDEFPNFKDVIDGVFSDLRVSAISDTKGVYFTPLLMVGDPGIGKTYFTKRLSQELGLNESTIDLSTSTSSMVLTGSSSKWGNSAPGLIAKTLMKNKAANQIVRLDELDKAGTTREQNVSNSLISLLEKHSASEFVDEWLEVPIDASHLSYLATANTLATLESHILSRFSVVTVKPLTAQEMEKVVPKAYLNLLKELEIDNFTKTVSKGVAKALASLLDVRTLRSGLMSGLTACVKRDGKMISVADVAPYVKRIEGERQEKSRSIGFH